MEQKLIFDTHSHYDDKRFDEDRDELLNSLRAHGVGCVVNVGADMESSRAALRLSEQYDFVYAALGVHPSDTEGLTEADIDWLREHSSHEKVVAIGEIGLDYYWPEPSADVQKRWFVRQIELAQEVGLPIIVHSRDTAEQTMTLIRETEAYECGGVIHCYSYSPELAKEYVKMGFYIGVGGVVTFKNGKKLKQTVEQIPLEHIVLETDCPYLAPEPNRGKRNDSRNLRYVVDEVARLKNISKEEVIRITTENALEMYRLHEHPHS